MYTFKITFQLYGGGRKTYSVKAGNREAAIDRHGRKHGGPCWTKPAIWRFTAWGRLRSRSP